MTFEEYQKRAIKTDTFGGDATPITDPAFISKLLGLVDEAGEVAGKFKKIYRDNDSQMTVEKLEDIKKELGDVLWYISVMCSYLGLSFEEVAELNLAKLQDRQARGKLKGSGDHR